MPTVSASAPKDAEAVGSERAAKLSGGAAENYDLKFAEDAKFKVVKNKVGVYVKYGSNTLSTAYDDEKYRTVNAAVGQEEYIFTTGYSDAVYDCLLYTSDAADEARSGMQREQGCRCGRRVPGISPVARKSFFRQF